MEAKLQQMSQLLSNEKQARRNAEMERDFYVSILKTEIIKRLNFICNLLNYH